MSRPPKWHWRSRSSLGWLLGAVLGLALLTGLVLYFAGKYGDAAAAPSHKGDLYTCSMHPSVQSEHEGSCPICGMTLTRVTHEQAVSGTIMVDDVRQRLGGVNTAVASVAPLTLSISASARLAYDEFSLSDVTLRVPGYVTALHVLGVGQEVQKGDPLLTIQSAELYAAQREMLSTRDAHMAHAARDKLMLLGMSEEQLAAVVKRGEPQLDFDVLAPASGFAISKEVVIGTRVQAGQRAFRLASTERLWVEADVEDRDMPELHIGQVGQITQDYLPGQTFEAYVIYVYRYIETTARTGRVRLSVMNSAHRLRPGMAVSVKFQAELGPRLQVPASAVLYTGARRLLFVSDSAGQFRPQEVQVGRQAGDMLEIVSGLQPGQVIATTGTFLLAAEARISTNTPFFDRATATEDGAPMDKVADKAAMPPSAAPADGKMAMPPSAAPGDGRMAMPPSAAPADGKMAMPPAAAPGDGKMAMPPAAAPADGKMAMPPAAAEATHAAPAPQPSAASPQAVRYVCPMHPEVQSDKPGKCSKCGMNLVPAPPPPARP